MRAVLRRRNFALLWAGGLVSSLGDWFLFIALPFYVYDLTGSALATGGMFIAESLPSILFGSIAGVFVDRWDRRRAMILADLSRGALLLLLLFARSAETVWLVYPVTFVQATIGLVFGPARSALIPSLVDEDELMSANSLSFVSTELTRLIGPALGGALLGLLGLVSVVLADSLSFVFSAAMVALIALPPGTTPSPTTPGEGAVSPWAAVWRDFREGLSLLRQNRVVSTLLLTIGIFMVGQGIINVLIVPFVKDVLHGGAVQMGWVVSAQGICGLVGGLALGQFGKAASSVRLIAVGFIATGLLIVATVNAGWLPLVLLFVALVGVAAIGVNVSADTLLQTAVADRFRGRIFAAYGTIQSALVLGGMGLASALGGSLGTVPMLDAAGALGVLSGIVAAVLLPAATSEPVIDRV